MFLKLCVSMSVVLTVVFFPQTLYAYIFNSIDIIKATCRHCLPTLVEVIAQSSLVLLLISFKIYPFIYYVDLFVLECFIMMTE